MDKGPKAPFTLHRFHTEMVWKFFHMKAAQCRGCSILLCNSLHLMPNRKMVQCRRYISIPFSHEDGIVYTVSSLLPTGVDAVV